MSEVAAAADLVKLGLGMLPALIKHNAAIAALIRDKFEPELSRFGMQTRNDLQTLNDPLVALIKREFLALAEKDLGRPATIVKMWGYMQEPGHQLNQREFMLHAHRSTLSIVYYAKVPADLVYPQGSFTLALPQLVHLLPVEGMFLSFGRGVEHEVFPSPDASGLRASVVACLEPEAEH